MSYETPEPPQMAEPQPPPIYESGPPPVFYPGPPPVQAPLPSSKPKPKGIWGAILAALAAIGKFLAPIWKFLLIGVKFLKLGKVLLTGGTMLISILLYAQIFGWRFAVGFVVCIFIHEMGHVFMAWRKGLPVSAPIFIPYFGALIMLKRAPRTAWVDAVVGIGGPLFGALSGVGCWAIFSVTGNYLFLGLAYMAFFLNLFNLTPIYPLDGGRIVGAISHWIWVIGLAIMVAMVASGFVRNPLIFILILMSLPQVWARFTNKNAQPEPATKEQRIGMGLAYIGLATFLFWAMSATHLDIRDRIRSRSHTTVASIER